MRVRVKLPVAVTVPLLVAVIEPHTAAFDRVRPTAMLLELDARPVCRTCKGRSDVAVGLPELMHEI